MGQFGGSGARIFVCIALTWMPETVVVVLQEAAAMNTKPVASRWIMGFS